MRVGGRLGPGRGPLRIAKSSARSHVGNSSLFNWRPVARSARPRRSTRPDQVPGTTRDLVTETIENSDGALTRDATSTSAGLRQRRRRGSRRWRPRGSKQASEVAEFDTACLRRSQSSKMQRSDIFGPQQTSIRNRNLSSANKTANLGVVWSRGRRHRGVCLPPVHGLDRCDARYHPDLASLAHYDLVAVPLAQGITTCRHIARVGTAQTTSMVSRPLGGRSGRRARCRKSSPGTEITNHDASKAETLEEIACFPRQARRPPPPYRAACRTSSRGPLWHSSRAHYQRVARFAPLPGPVRVSKTHSSAGEHRVLHPALNAGKTSRWSTPQPHGESLACDRFSCDAERPAPTVFRHRDCDRVDPATD